MASAARPVAAGQLPQLRTPLSEETQLEYFCRNTQACVLRPYCFFVSWQGVLTLAYRGFPEHLVQLKQLITDFFQGLPKESPGSKWPKTSLACLQEGRRLTPAQLQRLNELCRDHSGIFQTPGQKRVQSVMVSSLSAIVYETRCLERVISRKVMQLTMPADVADASAEEMQRVQDVVAEADDADYWFHASRDGNREKHYRSPALGVTLVHELGFGQPKSATAAAAAAAGAGAGGSDGGTGTSSSQMHLEPPSAGAHSSCDGSDAAAAPVAPTAGTVPSAVVWSSALPGIISKFRSAIEAEMPGLYAWFDDASLHITIRAIIV